MIPAANTKMNVLEKVSRVLEKVVIYISIISAGILCLGLIFKVTFRYFLAMPLSGVDELSLFLLAWITFLGASLNIRRNEMIAMSLLVERMGRFYWMAMICLQVLILLFTLLLLYYGYNWATSSSVINTNSLSLGIPMWIPYSVFPFSMFVMVIFILNNIQHILEKRARYESNNLS